MRHTRNPRPVCMISSDEDWKRWQKRGLLTRIRDWYTGYCVMNMGFTGARGAPQNAPVSRLKVFIDSLVRFWVRLRRSVHRFWLRHWQWIITTIIALCVLVFKIVEFWKGRKP